MMTSVSPTLKYRYYFYQYKPRQKQTLKKDYLTQCRKALVSKNYSGRSGAGGDCGG